MLKVLAAACLPAVIASCVAAPLELPQPAYRSTAALRNAAYTRPAAGGGEVANYAGRGDGGRISVRLTSLADGRTRAEGSVAGSGEQMCMGTFSGTGRFQGRTMQVAEESLPGCVVTIVRDGRRVTVDAGGRACIGLSGPSCSLSGTVTQR